MRFMSVLNERVAELQFGDTIRKVAAPNVWRSHFSYLSFIAARFYFK